MAKDCGWGSRREGLRVYLILTQVYEECTSVLLWPLTIANFFADFSWEQRGKVQGWRVGSRCWEKNDGREEKRSLHVRFSAAVLIKRLLSLFFPLTFMLILKKWGKKVQFLLLDLQSGRRLGTLLGDPSPQLLQLSPLTFSSLLESDKIQPEISVTLKKKRQPE